jgi:hypothetical protein
MSITIDLTAESDSETEVEDANNVVPQQRGQKRKQESFVLGVRQPRPNHRRLEEPRPIRRTPDEPESDRVPTHTEMWIQRMKDAFKRDSLPTAKDSYIVGSEDIGKGIPFRPGGPPQGSFPRFLLAHLKDFPWDEYVYESGPIRPWEVSDWARRKWEHIPEEVRAKRWPLRGSEYNPVPRDFAADLLNKGLFPYEVTPANAALWRKFLSEKWSGRVKYQKNQYKRTEKRNLFSE